MKRLGFSLIILCLLGLAFPAWGQESTLPPDQQALFDRMVTANAVINGYQSYIKTSTEENSNSMVMTANGAVVQEDSQTEVTESLSAVQRGDAPNAFYAEFRTMTQPDESYIMQGELRYVEGVLYAQGTYVEGTGPYVFPLGFITITDPANAGEFSALDPEAFLSEVDGIPTDDNPLLAIDQLQGVVESVISEAGEVDGQPVEVITLTLGKEGLLTFLNTMSQDSGDTEIFALLMDYISEDSGLTMSIAFDDLENVLQGQANMNLNVVDADMSQLDPSIPAGTLANITMTLTLETTYSQINAVTELVAAP